MSMALMGVMGIVVLVLVLFLLGMPVGFAMGMVGFLGFCVVISFKAGLNMLAAAFWETFSKYGLTVIPLFIFMGQIAFHAGINAKLYAAAYRWIGHIRGGIAMATVITCAAFAAICGSNAATAATMSTVALPQMKKFKYHPRLSTGAVACGSTLGVVIPPSVVLIVIGLSTGQSIATLFYGGVGAGCLLALLLTLSVGWICYRHRDWGPAGPLVGWRERFKALSGAVEMVLIFLLVMLGLFFGFFTPTEAGAAGSMLAVVLTATQGRLKWQGLIAALKDTIRISCMVMMIVTGAVIFGKFLAVTRIPHDLAAWITHLPVPRTVVMLVIFLVYLMGGAVMDALALLLITIPIFFPVAIQLGYDPVWFGVIITVITTLGAVTPPVGATTYVVGGMAAEDIPLKEVFRGVAYFLPAYILCVVILMIMPGIITWLPALMR